MRIVIDMQGAQTESRFRGIGRYTLAFAKAVVRNRGYHEVILALSGLFPDTIDPLRQEFADLLPHENICVWRAPSSFRQSLIGNDGLRRSAECIREAFLLSLRPNIIHVSSLFEGFGDDAVTSVGTFDDVTPVSVTLYDLIPLLNADRYLSPHPLFKKHYLRKIEYLKRASVCLAISDFCKVECESAVSELVGKCIAVSTGVDQRFRRCQKSDFAPDEIRERFGITRPFIMYTGGADERKNLSRLIQAFGVLPEDVRKHHQLLFAGKLSSVEVVELERIARSVKLGLQDVLFTGYVDDHDLNALYNLCRLFVFPSWHEGFGLPVLEAMVCGAPVIGANSTSLPEVIGLAEALFDPFKVEEIASIMQRALEDESFRKSLISHSVKQCQRFSWDTTAASAILAWEAIDASDGSTSSCSAGSLTLKDIVEELSVFGEQLDDRCLVEIANSLAMNESAVRE